MTTESRSKRSVLGEISAAWTRYVIVLGGVGVVAITMAIVLWPETWHLAVEYIELPRYEAAFGFRGGRIPVQNGDRRYTVYGFATITPGGRLDRAGVRTGDIPGLLELEGALADADRGVAGRFSVVAASDWPQRPRGRRITIEPQTTRPVPREGSPP